jgi:hypothetical protein
MNRFQKLLLAPAALGLVAPLAVSASRPASAADLNIAGVSQYGIGSHANSQEQVTSITQFSDLQPTDWAYQALSNLIERYGCVAGYPNGTYKGKQAMTRYEAAALLNACLDRITDVTDELKRLMKEFEKELAVLKGRVDGLEAKVGQLDATQFSTTTKLSGIATFVLGVNSFSGTATDLVDRSQSSFGATTFNYDMKLIMDTSFSGKDLLRIRLRAGNFDSTSNSFGGAGPSTLSQLEVAFQEQSGADNIGINRIYYQLPVGDFTFTIGGRVEQDNMVAIWPSLYPSDTILDLMTFGGSIGANDLDIGVGAGVWWQKHGIAISTNYVAANGELGDPSDGGIATQQAGGTGTLQIGYAAKQWAIAATYAAIQNGDNPIPYGTNFALKSFNVPGNTSAFGLGGYWQPTEPGWIPSISAGWGITATRYTTNTDNANLVGETQSWSVGLMWDDALRKGNVFGMAVGQATFATSLNSGKTPNDSNYVWEWWYRIQLTDHIALVPALFYLSRPLGADTPASQSFNQLGALVKTSFKF